MTISMYELIGKGYENGWYTNCNARYRIFKGARNTKKSYDILGYEVIFKILQDKRRNVLIVRKTLKSNRTSTYTVLKKLLRQIKIINWFKFNESNLEITYTRTGQKIMFLGLDDPSNIQGINVAIGYMTDVYFEEAFEIESYETFRVIDGSIRGLLPEDLFFQITLCMNAWDIGSWIYDKFFKGRFEDDLAYLEEHTYQDYYDPNYLGDYGQGLYLHTSTYKINEFRNIELDNRIKEELKIRAPEIYKVEALGMWGQSTESVYPELTDGIIKDEQYINTLDYYKYAIGIDTGLSNGEGKIKKGENVKIRSATTMQIAGLTKDCKIITSIDEFFHSNETMERKTEPQLQNEIIDKIMEWQRKYEAHPILMKGMITVFVDSADKGFREGLEIVAKQKGLYNIQFIASTKLRIWTRIDFARILMSFGEFLISKNCKNLIREMKSIRRGQKGEPREDINDHAINANEYAWASFHQAVIRWANFKER